MSASVAGRSWTWLELLRVSNLPTVASNVLVGLALGAMGTAAAGSSFGAADGAADAGVIDPWRGLAVGVAGVLSYLAGMALNDAFDADRDAAARSRRPIPSGRVTRRSAFVFGAVALAGALGVLVPLGAGAFAMGSALGAAIVVYDAVHHRVPTAVACVLMGLCRVLLVLLAAVAVNPAVDPAVVPAVASDAGLGAVASTPVVVVAGVIGAYTGVVTWLARGEEDAARLRSRWAAHALPVIGLLPVAVAQEPVLPLAIVAGAVLLAWHARSMRHLATRPPMAIMGWLAGLALVDACALALLGESVLAVGALACFVTTALAHRRILGS